MLFCRNLYQLLYNYNFELKNYFNSGKDLEDLGLVGQDMTVIVNFDTRNIIAKKGIKDEGKMYYRPQNNKNELMLKEINDKIKEIID